MQSSPRMLSVVAMFYLINASVGTAIAIRENLPGEFAGRTSGKPARDDFVTGSGTALSPPLAALVTQALLVLVLQSRKLRNLGFVGLTISGVAFTVGMLGEPIAYRVLNPRTFHLTKASVVAGNIVLPVLMTVLGLKGLRRAS